MTCASFAGVGNAFSNAGGSAARLGWVRTSFSSFGDKVVSGLTTAGRIAKTMAHGVAGGLSGKLSGGSFSKSFVSVGFTQAVSPGIDHIGGVTLGGSAARIVAGGLVGGAATALAGGKFANGASTAAFLATTVAAADYYRDKVNYDADIVPSTEYVRDADGNIIRYEGVRPPGPEYDVSGLNRNIEGHWLHPRNTFKQGGIVGRIVNYVLPFGKATSHLHDTWLNVNPGLSNTGTMLPAYAISAAAVPGVAFRGWESNPMAWHYISQPPRRRDDD